MCGIIGSTKYKITRNSQNDLHHRGPDARGLFSSEEISLGHTRLSIIGMQSGKQPMFSEDLNKALVFNGEIYNYLELRQELSKFSDISTDSDTRVLLRYYEAFGIERALQDINGMFSFALWDNIKRKLFLVRDRIGIKPLYYSIEGEDISFCSQINPIKKMIGIDRLSIDPISVAMFFNTYYIASPNTIWNEIRSLEPGHYIEYDMDKKDLQFKKYWSLERAERNASDLGHLEALLKDSVSLRMRSDAPYGAYLSGGVDSSLIVKHLSSIRENCKTFTAEIVDKELNDQKYAAQVAEEFNTNHTNIPIEYGEIKISFLRELVRMFDQPFADSSIIPTYLISKKISENVTVALGGDGADEVFCGYNKYNYVDQHISEKFFRNQNIGFLEPMYRKDTLGYMFSKLPYETDDKQEKLRLLDIRFFLEGDILQKIDRLSMANSLEARVPFLDHRIVEYSNNLTYDLMFGKIRKYPIKSLLEKYFSKDFVHRSKIGFMLNFDGWNDKFDKVITNSQVRHSGIFNKNFDISTIKDGYLKFAILMFTLWYEEHYA